MADDAGSDRHRFRFTRQQRLLNAADFSQVFDGAQARASHQYLLLLARPNKLPSHRLGLVIARKNVRLAVQRNRVKRVTREFFRQLPASDPSMDVVLLARRGLAELDNDTLSSILRQQWQRLERHIHREPVTSNRD